MATAIESTNIGKGTMPEAITTIFPLGTILYPTHTDEIDESFLDKLYVKKMKLEILDTLKRSTKKIGEIIFEDIPVPDRFNREDIYEKWEEMVNKIYNDLIEQVNNKDIKWTNDDLMLIENFRIIRKMEDAINDNQRDTLANYIESYQTHVNDNFKLIESTLFTIRRKFSIIYFESKLKPAFMTSISKTINTMLSYFYYLNSELSFILSTFRQLLHGRSKIDIIKKKTKAVFARISGLDLIEFALLIDLMKLQLFMDIWSSKNKDELFQTKTKYDNEAIDNEHFDNILKNLTKISDDLHYKLIEITREREKDIPFTFSNNITNKDEEKMHLISRIIHNV
ncbi:MAG: hypothetical protein JXA54_03850 [Candidatus Heimdallarchaeota archaeon]|nr:hypothetical protein [Candidatus Heimdallarchaeota archaeon]